MERSVAGGTKTWSLVSHQLESPGPRSYVLAIGRDNCRAVELRCRRAERLPLTLSAGAMQRLTAHPWPGNVGELRNAMLLVAAELIGMPIRTFSTKAKQYGLSGRGAKRTS